MFAASIQPPFCVSGRQRLVSSPPACCGAFSFASAPCGGGSNAAGLDWRPELGWLQSGRAVGADAAGSHGRGMVQVWATAANTEAGVAVQEEKAADSEVILAAGGLGDGAAKPQEDAESVEKIDGVAGAAEEVPEAKEATEAKDVKEDKEAKVKSPEKPAKVKRRAADWKKAVEFVKTGAIHDGKVEGSNTGGLLVRYLSLLGFLPLSQLDWSRVPEDGSKTILDVAKGLVGETLKVKIIEANNETKRLIFSEKQAIVWQNLRDINVGDFFEGVVNSVTEYGAFVNLKFPDGSYKVSGLIHISELSWNMVKDPKTVVEVGQEVKVKVVTVDREKGRLALSLKQLEADPLFETLDTLMPVEAPGETSSSEDSPSDVPDIPLAGLEVICEELLKEEGVTAVTLGRQASEKRVVSQDLELWVSNERVEDGSFTLLARAGRQVQEVHVTTTLDKEGIKAAVQRVTGRVE